MLQKVVVKKLSNKQIFDLLFREPTPEEKEILEKMKMEKERRELSVWVNPKENEKKKIICKIKPIFSIEESIGNDYCIKYYKFSGHAMIYKNNKLTGIGFHILLVKINILLLIQVNINLFMMLFMTSFGQNVLLED